MMQVNRLRSFKNFENVLHASLGQNRFFAIFKLQLYMIGVSMVFTLFLDLRYLWKGVQGQVYGPGNVEHVFRFLS